MSLHRVDRMRMMSPELLFVTLAIRRKPNRSRLAVMRRRQERTAALTKNLSSLTRHAGRRLHPRLLAESVQFSEKLENPQKSQDNTRQTTSIHIWLPVMCNHLQSDASSPRGRNIIAERRVSEVQERQEGSDSLQANTGAGLTGSL